MQTGRRRFHVKRGFSTILGVLQPGCLFLARLSILFTFRTMSRMTKSDREIEILFRRLRLYDQLGRRAEGSFDME
jgi:hypothetical protein